ncbi:MAG: flagellar hook-associated protein FlgK [Clostridiales bacterium]|nr:flagellar hook-associated protein FlgK [Clostridiales bacterium]
MATSTFAGYYVARSGVVAARSNLQITGQNITNMNTEGYTRQSVVNSSIPSVGNNMRYSDTSTIKVGQGVSCDSVIRNRDETLDNRYRAESPKTESFDLETEIKTDLENILDEIKNDNGIQDKIAGLIKQLQNLSTSPGDTNYESIVKNTALGIAKLFNQLSTSLQEVKDQQAEYFSMNVENANTIIKQIASLNEEIKRSQVTGADPLELEDTRDQLLDKLSEYCDIETSKVSVSVGSGKYVDELNVVLVGKDGTKYSLIDNDVYSKFNYTEVKDANGNITDYQLSLTKLNGSVRIATNGTTAFDDSVLNNGKFATYLSMLNDNGVYDTPPTTTNGIGYYQQRLDTLANYFADVLNKVNSSDSADATNYDKPFFTNGNGSTDSTGITAANISISQQWKDCQGSYITSSKVVTDATVDSTKRSDNILFMISEINKSRDFYTDTGEFIFQGNVKEYATDISDTLGLEITFSKSNYETSNTKLNTINDARLSVSSVDVNEESINMVMYNQSFQASSRFMTTMDELINQLINNMGLVGR